MRLLSPSSLGHLRVRLCAFDIFCAFAAPLIALDLREAYVLSPQHAGTAALYCGLSFGFSLLAFLAFRINDGMSHFFSFRDALNVLKAVALALLLTALVMFSMTRLEGIPRTAPLIHLVVLSAALLAARLLMLLMHPERKVTAAPNHHATEHVIMIGSTSLSALYIQFLRAYSAGRRRVVAVLDSNPRLLGRAIHGVPIVAPPRNLDAIIDEFVVHGIHVHRIIVAGDRDFLPESTLRGIREICEQRNLELDFVTQLVGLHDLPPLQPVSIPAEWTSPTITLQPYFQFKRLIDFFGALTAIIILSPIFLLTALLVLIDVGPPVLFWQQRMGQSGCSFLLYKFRTLRAPFDFHGNRIADDRRLSLIGRLLRKFRFDELPQLFNVLVGDMSLIGPRPLLPIDQPSNESLRLAVRPGITGWAQINGGNLITAEEKGALDEFYVRNASLWFDLRIVALTVRFAITGERRSEEAVAAARSAQQGYAWHNPLQENRQVVEAMPTLPDRVVPLRARRDAQSFRN
jgi:lipopolysaccharide/colanic/teichoic acid biosynthesis glycosyltransferase